MHVWASPALAATSAAVMLCSFWRIRNVSAGPTTLATQSHRHTRTRIVCASTTHATLSGTDTHDGAVTWCWWNCWWSGVSYQREAPTASPRRTNSEDYKRIMKSLFYMTAFLLRILLQKRCIWSESWIQSSADLWLVTMYPYSSLPPVPSTSGSPCFLKSCPVSAGAACGGWDAEAGRMALLVGVGVQVEERAGVASGGPGTGAGFSGLWDTLSVFSSCIYRVRIEELSVKADAPLLLVNAADSGCYCTYLLQGDEVFLSWMYVERDKRTFLNRLHSETIHLVFCTYQGVLVSQGFIANS